MVPYPDPAPRSSGSLVDVLDRVLDKGLVVAGDIRVALADVELLTIRIRLLVCSIDKAEEIGLDWWRADPELSSGARGLTTENESLRERIRVLEHKLNELAALPAGGDNGGRRADPASGGATPARSKKARKKKKR